MKTILFLLLLTTQAYAYPAGECKCLEWYCKDTPFYAEGFKYLNGAIDFQTEKKGQLVTEHGKEQYYVIYNDNVAAPATQYTCARTEDL